MPHLRRPALREPQRLDELSVGAGVDRRYERLGLFK